MKTALRTQLKRKVKRVYQKLQCSARRQEMAALFAGVHNLEELHRALPQVVFEDKSEGISGWSSYYERRTLYALGRYVDGPLLEIGAWAGRSAICLANGIADSGKKKEFITCELAPTMDNFRPVNDKEVGFFYPVESLVNMGNATLESFNDVIKPILTSEGGILGHLDRNLRRFGLAELVQVFKGDFRDLPPRPFRFLFSDALHSVDEVRNNLPGLQKLLGSGSIFSAHDSTDENIALFKERFNFGYSFRVDSLFVGQIS